MAVQVELAGATTIRVSQPSTDLGNDTGNAINLGFSRNGVSVSYETFYLDVPGDELGGDDGPPIEVQRLGAIARIRCELTKFDKSVFQKLATQINGQPWGNEDKNNKFPGTLLFTTANITRVSLVNANDSRYFPRCFIRAAIDYNYATKYTAPIIEFEAHRDPSGDLHTASTENLPP